VIISEIILLTRKFLLANIRIHRGGRATRPRLKIWETYIQLALDIPRRRLYPKQKGTNMKAACSLLGRLFGGLVVVAVLSLALTPNLTAQTDPGARPAGNTIVFAVPDQFNNVINDTAQVPPNVGPCTTEVAGCFLPNLTGPQTTLWFAGLVTFGDLVSVQGTPKTSSSTTTPGEPIPGLGPMYNGNSCAMCHLQPAIGGSSPGIGTPFFTTNPQFAVATHRGAINTPPSFVHKADGPVVETRFPQNIDANGNPLGTLDGSVHDLYTIEGRNDAPTTCNLVQDPFFQTEITNNNIIFRIPTPTFGLGFVETTSDLVLQNNLTASQGLGFGTGGRFNSTGNDQTFTRFGWKAQNPSLLMFSGEASNVEMGVTNELFPFEREPGNCATNPTPEDFTIPTAATTIALNPPVDDSDIEALAFFMFTNAAPAQCDFASGVTNGVPNCNPLGASALRGRTVFSQLGCNSCHSTALATGPSNFVDLNNATFQPFSDFAIHHMGSKLTDGVTQGAAGPDEFRTAPLWGLGQRRFLMHDGKSTTLLSAITRHQSPTNTCTDVTSVSESFILNGSPVTIQPQTTQSCGSDANTVINNFNNLLSTNPGSVQDLYDFLRSL
jgi:hypothetical protein